MEPRLDTSLTAGLGQQLRTSPRMIQSMEVLQMPLPALQERIDQELESNIALEVNEALAGTEEDSTDPEDDAPEAGAEEFQRLDSMERTYSEAYDNTLGSRSLNRASGDSDRKLEFIANLSAPGQSLQDEMLHQWTFADVTPEVALAGQCLIECLSPSGLLEGDLERVLDAAPDARERGVTLESLEAALPVLQALADPPGIGGRSLQECLLLQVATHLEQDDDRREAWERVGMLIESHLDDLVQNRLPDIARSTGLSMDDVREAMHLMHRLTLAPGSELAPADVPPVIPDVLVEYDDASDSYAATLLDGPIPPLRVSPRYEKMARDPSLDAQARAFLGRNVESARWLIDALRQRGATLLKVVRVVLDRQREFFDEGPRHLKPLPMTEVADIIGVHVATVSRAVSDKWMQTPRGVVPLRRFFSGGTATAAGEAMSWAAVREVLREIVEQEDSSRPLSDEALAAALRERGIDIARRTVVKYRQKMGIPPARLRRTF